MRFAKGFVALVKKKDGRYVYSEPYALKSDAQAWADTFEGGECLRIEENEVPVSRLATLTAREERKTNEG